jgi:hypothetical protein
MMEPCRNAQARSATSLLARDIVEHAIAEQMDGKPLKPPPEDHKHMINVSFLKNSGCLLPGGARRLNQTTDRAIEVALQ